MQDDITPNFQDENTVLHIVGTTEESCGRFKANPKEKLKKNRRIQRIDRWLKSTHPLPDECIRCGKPRTAESHWLWICCLRVDEGV